MHVGLRKQKNFHACNLIMFIIRNEEGLIFVSNLLKNEKKYKRTFLMLLLKQNVIILGHAKLKLYLFMFGSKSKNGLNNAFNDAF